jgi:diguanylate cyclase (GGDEF)-like protein
MDQHDYTGGTETLVKLSFFVDIGKDITRAKTIDETLHQIMNHIGNIFAPLNWSILLRNPETGDLTFTLVVGQNAHKLRGLKLPKGEGIAGWVAETGQPVIVEDVAKDRRFSNRVDEFTGFTTQSIIGVPLLSDDRVFGVIELINKLNGKPFTPFDLKILTTIADFAAIAIEKSYYLRALKKMATTDALTGARNRGAFERAYVREAEMCRRYDQPLAFMMIDVDKFKQINDAHGHVAGDEVLRNVVELLSDCVRKVDSVYRYGGDEFVILMPNTTKDQAEAARHRIQERVEYQNSLNPPIPYTLSIGLHAMDSAEDAQAIAFLDMDLYRQKDKKLAANFESMEENLEELLQEERSKFRPEGKNRKG